jgi:ribosome-binding factor A
MNKKKSMIRKFLGDSLKDKLRTIPDLKFVVDDSLARMRRIEDLLKDVTTD